VLALHREEPDAVEPYLRTAITWVADAYDTGLGLAPVGASPEQEGRYLLGPELEHVTVTKAPTSFSATVLLDLATAARLRDTYEFGLNEFLACDARPTLVAADETRAQWGASREGLERIPVVPPGV
jgi:hypothetical protein